MPRPSDKLETWMSNSKIGSGRTKEAEICGTLVNLPPFSDRRLLLLSAIFRSFNLTPRTISRISLGVAGTFDRVGTQDRAKFTLIMKSPNCKKKWLKPEFKPVLVFCECTAYAEAV